MTQHSTQDNYGFDSYYSWVVLGVTWMCGAVSLGFGLSSAVYMSSFTALYPGNEVLISALFSLQIGLISFAGPLAALVCVQFGARTAVLCGASLCTGGYLCAAYSQHLWQLFISFSIMTGIGQAFLYNVGMSLAPSWFRRYLNFAGGVTQSSISAGVSVGGYLLSKTIAAYGWRTTCIIEAAVCVHLLVGGALLRRSPKDREVSSALEPKTRTIEVFRQLLIPKFGVYCISTFLWGAGQTFYYIFVMEVNQSAIGDNTPVLMVVISAVDFVSRLTSGALANYCNYHQAYAYFIGLFLNGIVIACTPFFVGTMGSYIGAVLYGATQGWFCGVAWTTLHALLSDTPLTASFGIAMLSCGLGAVAAGPIARALFNASAPTVLGKFGTGFGVFGVVIMTSALVFGCAQLMDFKETKAQCWSVGDDKQQTFNDKAVCVELLDYRHLADQIS